jgi:hypothetical protein
LSINFNRWPALPPHSRTPMMNHCSPITRISSATSCRWTNSAGWHRIVAAYTYVRYRIRIRSAAKLLRRSERQMGSSRHEQELALPCLRPARPMPMACHGHGFFSTSFACIAVPANGIFNEGRHRETTFAASTEYSTIDELCQGNSGAASAACPAA